jgi:uncharacterized protein YfaQ (DUF2300 family)
MCRMCSTDNEPDSITDDRPEHEPHTVTVCVADNGTHAFTIDVAECESECEPDRVTIGISCYEPKCVAVCGTVCVADVVS